MTQQTELEYLRDHIPPRSKYPKGKLQISLPTTSNVQPGDALKLVHEDATTKGWKIEDITIIRKSGYIACDDCKKALHIHISGENQNWCMNCKSHNVHFNEAEVDIVD